MKIEYKESLLQQILNINQYNPISTVDLTEEEYGEVIEEIHKREPKPSKGDYWVSFNDITFYNQGDISNDN